MKKLNRIKLYRGDIIKSGELLYFILDVNKDGVLACNLSSFYSGDILEFPAGYFPDVKATIVSSVFREELE